MDEPQDECDTPPLDVCMYSTAHMMDGVPATTTVPNPVLGPVPACQKCADFYARMS